MPKTLTLDYDVMGNDYFELYVINDGTMELYHPNSGPCSNLKEGNGQVDKKGRTMRPLVKIIGSGKMIGNHTFYD